MGEKFVPHVIEPSYGIDRILYFILEHNYIEGKKKRGGIHDSETESLVGTY